jgi:hypothetical protein
MFNQVKNKMIDFQFAFFSIPMFWGFDISPPCPFSSQTIMLLSPLKKKYLPC